MKIFLLAVNARYCHSNPAVYLLKKMLAPLQHQVVSAEWSINNPRELILEQIYREKPDLVGLSAYIWNISYLEALADEIKSLLPQAVLILGGPQAGGERGELLRRLPAADALVIGEGEETFPLLIAALAQGQRANLPGVWWRGGQTYEAAPPTELSRLPFLYTKEELADLKGKIVYYESSRGCPYGCTFCFSAHQPLRERPLAMVEADLAFLAANFQGQFKLVDRTFNADKKRAVKISQCLLNLYDPCSSWHLEISPYNLSPQLLAVWQKAPPDYLRLEAGVQSLNTEALKAIGRYGDWSSAKASLASIMAQDNLRLHLDLIAGLPQETPESFAAGFNEVHALLPHYLQLGFLKVLPGSLLAKTAAAMGLVYSPRPPYRVLATPDLSAEDLFTLQSVAAAVDDYYNSGRFRQTLNLAAKHWPGGAISFYLALAGARKKAVDSPLSLREKAELLWLLLSSLPQKELFFDIIRLDWYLYGKGEPLPALLRRKEERHNSFPKGILLSLSHRIAFEPGAKIGIREGDAQYLIDQEQRLGVSKRSFCREI